MQERMGETAAALTESFAAARLVRAYRLEEQEEARAAAAFAGLRASLFKIARIRASLDPVLEVLGGLAVAAVLLFVGGACRRARARSASSPASSPRC
jgi:subfamily B ATP-binding cassette protein MsbA